MGTISTTPLIGMRVKVIKEERKNPNVIRQDFTKHIINTHISVQ